MERNRWYKDKVFYQIWPRSFKDGNNDGMGDLYGVLEKLDYIKSLGCDGIWFSPLYPSPGVDCGYDISNYLDIASEFGGMEAFKKVLDGAHERGMKVIMDLVVNHTSDEHRWFKEALKDPNSKYRNYYHFKDQPNNWTSFFSGSAWNQYDFFDSDGLDKTAFGTVMKTAVSIAPYLIPGVGQYVAMFEIGRSLVESLPELYKGVSSLVGSDLGFSTANEIAAFASRFNSSVSDAGAQKLLSFESIGNMAVDSIKQLYAQRTL